MTVLQERVEPAAAEAEAEPELRLVHVGWAHDLVVRAGLERPDQPRPRQRIIVFLLVTWVPLLLLSLVQGVAVGTRVRVPFILAFDPTVKLLLGLPVMLAAEEMMAERFGTAARQFLTAGLVAECDRSRYAELCRRASRLAAASLPEIVVLVLACACSTLEPMALARVGVPDWRAVEGHGQGVTAAWWWQLLVSQPLYRFVLFRWCWRFGLWSWFLRRVARLDLALVPTHADLAGGLGFLSRVQAGFASIILAICAALSATIAGLVVHGGVPLGRFAIAIGAFILCFVGVACLPLGFFSPHLVQARFRANLAHGALVSQHNRAFDEKWVRGLPHGDGLLGDPDASSLADTPTGYEYVQGMHVVPLTLADAKLLVLAAGLPFLPLLLTQLSLVELLKRLAQILL